MAATYDDLALDIDRVARNVASDYPDIDWEDVRQELCVFVLENGKSIKLKDAGGNPKWLLNRVAQDYCKKQRTQHMTLSPQYAYRPSDVALILQTAYQQRSEEDYVPDDARHPLSKTFNIFDDGKAFKPGKTVSLEREVLSETGSDVSEVIVLNPDPFHEIDFAEVSSDVREAARKLKPELREAIFDRYVLGNIPDNNSYQRKKLNKAVNELTRRLNSYRGFDLGKRRVMTNSAAHAAISNLYEG